MKTVFALLALLLLFPAAAFSQPYVAAKVSYAAADFPLDAPYNGVVDDNSLALCVEGDVCTLVVRPIDGNDMTLYHAAIVPRISAGDARFFARVGYYRANIDANIGLPGAGDFHEDGLMLGVGARWYFEDPWSVSLEATRFDDNVRQISVGFGWGLRPVGE